MERWTTFKTAMAECLNYGAMVYGGAVRDMMLHNIKSKEFYLEHTNSDYSDETVSPDTIDRMIIPRDIDCLIRGDHSTQLIHHFNTKYFLKIEEVKHVYFNKEKNTNYQHIKLVVLYSITKNLYVKIDMIVQLVPGELIMPFINLDFDVNGLTMTSDGFGLNECLRTKGQNAALNMIKNASRLQVILENIRQKKAFTIPGCAAHRFRKMKEYGWDITFKSKIFHYYFNEEYEGVCIICKDTITGCSVNYKECKCDLRICLACILKDYRKLNKCSLCTKICYDSSNVISDLLILRIKYISL